LVDLDVDEQIILKLVLTKYGMSVWTGINCSRTGSGCFEHSNELLDSIKALGVS
jgi:hypothetical protein